MVVEQESKVGIHYQPNHQLSLYQRVSEALPVVESIYPSLITLPLHPDMVEGDVLRVYEALSEAVNVS